MNAMKMFGAMLITASAICYGAAPARADNLSPVHFAASAASQPWADLVTERNRKLFASLVRIPVRVNARGFILKGGS